MSAPCNYSLSPGTCVSDACSSAPAVRGTAATAAAPSRRGPAVDPGPATPAAATPASEAPAATCDQGAGRCRRRPHHRAQASDHGQDASGPGRQGEPEQ